MLHEGFGQLQTKDPRPEGGCVLRSHGRHAAGPADLGAPLDEGSNLHKRIYRRVDNDGSTDAHRIVRSRCGIPLYWAPTWHMVPGWVVETCAALQPLLSLHALQSLQAWHGPFPLQLCSTELHQQVGCEYPQAMVLACLPLKGTAHHGLKEAVRYLSDCTSYEKLLYEKLMDCTLYLRYRRGSMAEELWAYCIGRLIDRHDLLKKKHHYCSLQSPQHQIQPGNTSCPLSGPAHAGTWWLFQACWCKGCTLGAASPQGSRC